MDTIAQMMVLLGVVCNAVMRLSGDPCNFVIGVVTIIVRMAMATGLAPNTTEYNGNQCHILDQLPTSLYTTLSRFNTDNQTTVYAVCPGCNCAYKPSFNCNTAATDYPTRCTNHIVGPSGSTPCSTELLEERHGRLRPIKPFLAASFMDYLARSLADAEIERLCDQACDDAMNSLHEPPNSDVTNVFQAGFMKTFEGPTPGQLFIDRGDKVRLAFAIHVDFFNPNGTRKRGNHDSIGIISLANLNLPLSIRYQPENIFLAGVIPGWREPEKDEISHFLRPIIDDCVVAWERGIHVSKTASSQDGRDVEVAIILSVNDLPAARKVSGSAGVRSPFYCTVCYCSGSETMYRSDFDRWGHRDASEARMWAQAWHNAKTLTEREEIFKQRGVRWSEFWRLPYWDPSRMLVIDSMHCIFEGIVHYHCRYVLGLDSSHAKTDSPLVPAFSYNWVPYGPHVPQEYCVNRDKEVKQISDIQTILTLPVGSGPGSVTPDQIRGKLSSKNLSALRFVCYSLNLPQEITNEQGRSVLARTKAHYVQLLLNWVCRRIVFISVVGILT